MGESVLMNAVIFDEDSVMLSITPEWCSLIVLKKKTLEIRKTKPKLKPPFQCYIYQTSEYIPAFVLSPFAGKRKPGRVIGWFICDYIIDYKVGYSGGDDCLTLEQQEAYLGPNGHGYGWHISDLHIYDHPEHIERYIRHRRNCSEILPTILCTGCEQNQPDDEGFNGCALALRRPPQSWCYCVRAFPYPMTRPNGRT